MAPETARTHSFSPLHGTQALIEATSGGEKSGEKKRDKKIAENRISDRAIHFVPKRGTTSSHQTIMELNHVVELSEAGFDASGRVVSRSGLSSSLGPGTDVVNLAWDNVKYEVLIKDPDNPKGRRVEKEIIHGVSGAVLAGQMLAILGGSGAGKSTLLDILAQRKSTGSITGSIYLNGTNVNDVQILFTRCSGYVTQEDIFLKTMTVRENLRYFATMTLGGLSRAERYAEVENVMEELNISHVANSKIGGVTDSRGLSGGEKKRVSIAESLLRRPKILFLDEPTSGLDSYNSQAVMELLNNLAIKRQMTIVASIHQPRSTIFDLFDKLMILQRGKTAFFGDASAAQSYFEKQGYPLPMGFNPPDFFIDVVLGKSNATTDFPSLFGESDLCKSVLSIVDEQKNSILHLTDGNLKPYAVSYPTQLRGLLGRWGRDALRNPEAFIVGAIQAVVLGCLVGSLFYNLPSDASGSQSRAGMLFLSLIFGSFTITNMAVMITQNRKSLLSFHTLKYLVSHYLRCTCQSRTSVWNFCHNALLVNSHYSRSACYRDYSPIFQQHFLLDGGAQSCHRALLGAHRCHNSDVCSCCVALQLGWSSGS